MLELHCHIGYSLGRWDGYSNNSNIVIILGLNIYKKDNFDKAKNSKLDVQKKIKNIDMLLLYKDYLLLLWWHKLFMSSLSLEEFSFYY